MKRQISLWVLAMVACTAFAQDATVAVVSPQNEQTLHDNNGNVAVQVMAGGERKPGDQLVLLFDGKPVSGKSGPRYQLTGVERGTHTLQAQILDSTGSPRATSAVVTFYMWQASRLSPIRKGQK